MSHNVVKKIAKEWARKWEEGMNKIAPPGKRVKEPRVKNFEKGISKSLSG